jgi:hypothetical protein
MTSNSDGDCYVIVMKITGSIFSTRWVRTARLTQGNVLTYGRWEDNIKIDLKEIGWSVMDWIICLRIQTSGWLL